MTLDQEDRKLFFRLWLPLLEFVNEKHHVCPETEPLADEDGIDIHVAKAIADHLWAHPGIIDDYLAAADLPEEHAQIVAGWKRCRPGRYVLERHLKKGSVFISTEDGAVYVVKGLFSSFEELLGRAPVLVDAVLLPFRDCVITDGLVMGYSIYFGKGAAGDFKDTYMRAKNSKAIHYTI